MNTIALNQLIKRIASIASVSEPQAEEFISILTRRIRTGLSKDGTITIDHIGTFRIVEIGNDREIRFAPEVSLAKSVNEPFAMFEPIEIENDIAISNLSNNSDVVNTQPVPPPIPQRADTPLPHLPHDKSSSHEETTTSENSESKQPEESSPCETALTPNVSETQASSETPINSTKPEPAQKPEPSETVTPSVSPTPHSPDVQPHHRSISLPAILIALIIGIILGFIAGRFIGFGHLSQIQISADEVEVYQNPVVAADTTTISKADTTAIAKDSIPAIAQAAVSAIVYDTIHPGRFLTTMARDHYGKKIFWVYIYRENSHLISDPDNIPVNTVLVIPPASKYDINPDDDASVDRARSEALAILPPQ